MGKIDYFDLVSMIIEDQLALDVFLKLCGVDQDAAEMELQTLIPVAYTFTKEEKPIYFFKHSDYPNLGQLFHWTKMYAFAHGGSPYNDGALSEYDIRKEYPYIQAAVYDSDKKMFITGLRFLSLSSVPSFEFSAMHSLFVPTDAFVARHMHNSIEIGQTFITPNTIGGNYLFSIMSAVIAAHKDARYLCGKPTIEGRIPDVSKEIISAFAYDAFNPSEIHEFNPSGEPFFSVVEGIVQPSLRSLADIVHQYNVDVRGIRSELQFDPDMSVQIKRKITEKLLVHYGGSLPPMFKFYSVLTEEKGMICLGASVVNPVYTNSAWEFPILLDKTKIVSNYKRLVDHYTEYFKDRTVSY